MEYLQSIFEEKYVIDTRVPTMEFAIPGFVDDNGTPTTFGLYTPESGLWKQVVVLLVLQILFQLFVATVVYQYVIKRRSTIESYIIGWGIILPLSCYTPYWLIRVFDIQNKVLKLACTGSMGVIAFRIIPAMYNTSPKYVEDSLESYMGYYSTNVTYIWNDKTRSRVIIPIKQRLESLGLFMFNFLMYSIVLSIMLYNDFTPFDHLLLREDKVQLGQFHLHAIGDLLHPVHILNAYTQAGKSFLSLFVFAFPILLVARKHSKNKLSIFHVAHLSFSLSLFSTLCLSIRLGLSLTRFSFSLQNKIANSFNIFMFTCIIRFKWYGRKFKGLCYSTNIYKSII